MKRILVIYRRFFWSKIKLARHLGVKVGNNCEFYSANFGSEPYLIEIGDHVQITHGVRFYTHGGGWVLRKETPNFDSFGKIKIGSNVYIGENSLIMPGVVIGDNVVVGAGSIVTKSVPSNTVIAGVPAKIVSTLEEYKKNISRFNLETKGMTPNEKKLYLLSMSEDKFIQKPYLNNISL